MIPPLRDYQSASIELLREGIRDGHPRQILCAPTGSGKTLVGAYLIAEAAAKGSKAAFVCDRVALVNQTSKVFTEFGIPHGVAQGQNTFGRSLPVQVCSAQTIEARGFWPDLDLVIVDQCCPGKVAPTDGKSLPLNVLWPVLSGNDLKFRGRKWPPERSIPTRHNGG